MRQYQTSLECVVGAGQAERMLCPLCNESEGAVHEKAQPRRGMTSLFSPESRAACSIQLLPTPDLQRQVSRKPGEFRSMQPKGPVICAPLLGLPGTDGCRLHYKSNMQPASFHGVSGSSHGVDP